MVLNLFSKTNFILYEVSTLFLPQPATFQKKAGHVITMRAHHKYGQCLKVVHVFKWCLKIKLRFCGVSWFWWCRHKTWGHHPCPGHLQEGSCRLSPLNSTHSSCCSCWLFSCNYFMIDKYVQQSPEYLPNIFTLFTMPMLLESLLQPSKASKLCIINLN